MLSFRDNPKELLEQLDQAAVHLSSNFDRLYAEAISSVVSNRWATNDMFPSHALFGLVETRYISEPWTPFAQRWLQGPGTGEYSTWLHHFDSQGRISIAHCESWGHLTIWQDDGCFRLRIDRSKESDKFELGSVYGGLSFSRYWHNQSGQILGLCGCDLQHGVVYRNFEWFEYDEKSCKESIKQCFVIMPEIPAYEEEKSEQELREVYRPLTGDEILNHWVEDMFMRGRFKYTYCHSGELEKAEEFDFKGKPAEELLFEKRAERSLEETVDDLIAKTATVIEKAVKKRSQLKPYRGLILVYSAEHPHCGLPHEVAVLGHDFDWPEEKYYQESYEDKLEVTFKRPVLSVLNEFNQRCYARFALDDITAQNQVVVSAMKKIAEKLFDAFDQTKHVTDDFEVLVIDDHGDVDSFSVSQLPS